MKILIVEDEAGIEVCRLLRSGGKTFPVIFLTAQDAREYAVMGLKSMNFWKLMTIEKIMKTHFYGRK